MGGSCSAVGLTYPLLQLGAGSQLRTHLDLVRTEVVTLEVRLADQHYAAVLAQLA